MHLRDTILFGYPEDGHGTTGLMLIVVIAGRLIEGWQNRGLAGERPRKLSMKSYSFNEDNSSL